MKSPLNLLCDRLIRLSCISLSLESMIVLVSSLFSTALKSYGFPYGLTSVEIYASLEFGCIFQLLLTFCGLGWNAPKSMTNYL